MATEVATLPVQPRTVLGKKVSQLRRAGLTPVHMYGSGGEPQALQVDTQVLRRVLTHAGHNRPIEVVTEGSSARSLTFVREIQFHPLTLEVLHVDLFRVDADITTTVDVPLELEGDSPAVRLGGSLIQNLHTVQVEARPLDVPGSDYRGRFRAERLRQEHPRFRPHRARRRYGVDGRRANGRARRRAGGRRGR